MLLRPTKFFAKLSIYSLLFIIGLFFFAASARAQCPPYDPVLVKDYEVGGTAYHNVNGATVPNPFVPVLVVTESRLSNYCGGYQVIATNSRYVMTDANGRFKGGKFACYRNRDNQLVPNYVLSAFIVGTGGGSGASGGVSCNEPDDQYLNALGPRGDTNLADIQNAGPSSCKISLPVKPVPEKGEPVNLSNGNMWLSQTDYSLSGVGENIKVNRFYNSIIQESGLFGLGWKSELDESVKPYTTQSATSYLALKTSTGKGYYLTSQNNTDYQSASAGFYGNALKNADGTFTITYQDGRTQSFSPLGKILWKRDRNGNQTTFTYNAGNQLIGVTDPFGRVLNILPNPNGTIAQISDAIGVVASYIYNPDNTLQSVNYPDGSKYQFDYIGISGKIYLTTVRDALNNILETHQYDAQGRATTSEKQGGVEKYTFDYTHTNDFATAPYTIVTDALGRTSKYTFDKTKGVNVVTQIEGNCNCGSGSQVTNYIYDNNLNMVKTVDAFNREINSTFDSKGNILTMTDPTGTETFTYNNFSQGLTRTDKMGGIWTNVYDGQGKLLTTTDPLNATTTLTYTPVGQVATVKDALNRVTTLNYDAQGRLGQIIDANTKTTTFAYDARSRLVTTTNALNFTTAFEYDAADRIKKVIDPLLRTVEYGYDLAGRRISTTDQRGFTSIYSYDGAYRMISMTDALNHTSQVNYDLMSNVIAQTDALGNVTSYEYDAFDRLTKVIYPLADTGIAPLFETFEYDQVGNLRRKVDTANRQTLYDYDAINRLIRTTDANNQITQFEYNQRNQLTAVTDALNQQYVFNYDPLGRVLNQTKAGSTMSFGYDLVGNQTQRTDYKGVTTNYVYDNLNRLKNINYPTAAENISFTYDSLSRLNKATNYAGVVDYNYTKRNQVSQVLDVHGRKINYTYDPAGNQNLMLLDDIQQTDYVFDRANRLQLIKNSEDNTQIDYNYDAANRLIRKILPNGISTIYQYDGMSRLTRLRDFKTNPDTTVTNIYNRGYAYNTASNISTITQPANQTKNFIYDNLDRLINVTNTAGASSENYGFDAVGNRTTSQLSTTYQYAAFNRLSNTQQASYVYDSNGNMVKKTDASGVTQYIWDFENRLRQVIKPDGTAVNYKYDALGRRTERYIGTNSTKFTYDGQDVILDVNSDGSFVKYLNGLGIDNKLSMKANGVTSYFTQDHLGSTNALTDATGNVISSATYDSFGNATGNLVTRYQYTGREKDETTGLMYYRNRWYDSNLGRFISEDPIGLAGGINQFGYVGGNPVNSTDPSGLIPTGSEVANFVDGNIIGPQQQYYDYVRNNYLNGYDIRIPMPGGNPLGTPLSDFYAQAYGFTDLGRIGEGTACAFADGENGWGTAAFLAMDIRRGANLFALLAGGGSRFVPKPPPTIPNATPSFLGQASGPAIAVPKGSSYTPVINANGNTTGFGYKGGMGGNGLSPKVDTVRIMNPTQPKGSSPGYPNGYVNYMNKNGQAVNPYSGQTIGKKDMWWHIPMN